MNNLILRALLLGLSSGPSCLGFCLPVCLPLFFGFSVRGVKPATLRLGLFLAGRLLAYLITGTVFGLLGATLANIIRLHRMIFPILYIILGILMALYGIAQLDPFARLAPCRVLSRGTESGAFPLLLGGLLGLSPCPPFLLALTTVLETGGIKNGALFFGVFFLATALPFTPLVLSGLLPRHPEVRIASRILSLITGGYFILLGIRQIV